MKQTLSKIGKVVSLVRREGLMRAVQRVWIFTFTSLHRVGAGQVLYINGGLGDNALYRGRHIVEELEKQGFVAAATIQDNPFLTRYVDRFDVFVLHRVVCSRHIERFIAAAKKAGKTIVFETDDLVFDAALMQSTDAYANMNALERTQYEDGLSSCVVGDDYVTHATTTTEPLARHLRERGKEVFIVPNKLSKEFVELANVARKTVAEEAVSRENFRIGYFSGSASHDRDFAVITEVLLDLMERFAVVELFIAGPLELDQRFEQFGERIIRAPYVSRGEHFINVARCAVNVAPLEVNDAYCEAKSAIKYYEAGIVAVPTVASATEVFKDAIMEGKTGFTAHTGQEWTEKLEVMINDRDRIKEMGSAALADVNMYHTTDTSKQCSSNIAYYNFLRQRIDGSIASHIAPLEKNDDADTAIVIVNWNGCAYLETCLKSLMEQSDQNFVVIVVDNGSNDGSREMLIERYPDVAWIALPENAGFAHPTNCGIRAALRNTHIQNIITLNNDAACDKEYIAKIRSASSECDDSVGAVQPKVLNFYHQDRIDSTGMITSFELSAINRGRDEVDSGQYDTEYDVFGPSASAALYKRKALEETMLPYAGYFDRSYFAYHEDIDLAWRLQSAGYRVRFAPEAIVYHVHSATGGNNSSFKAYHVHRNHFYNIIKNVPWFYLIALVFFFPMRYVLVTMSLLYGKGPAARLKKTAKKARTDGAVSIVLRSWSDVWRELPQLLRKRRVIAKQRKVGINVFFRVLRRHRATLKQSIFR